MFQITTERVRRSQLRRQLVRGAATEKALSPIRRRVRGTTRLPHDEARSVDRPGIFSTVVRTSEIYSGQQVVIVLLSTACFTPTTRTTLYQGRRQVRETAFYTVSHKKTCHSVSRPQLWRFLSEFFLYQGKHERILYSSLVLR